MLLSTLKTSNRTKTLDFRRDSFSILRAQLWGFPWEESMEGKGAHECWELFQNNLLEAQKQSIPYKGKGRRQNKRLPWFNSEFLSMLKSKKAEYWLWKGSQMAIKDYKNFARACRDTTVRKDKAQLGLKLLTDVKNKDTSDT